MEFLTEDEVMIVRRRLAQTTLAQRAFGGIEPLYPDRLSSAVSRQHTGFGSASKYSTVPEVAATLFYGLCLGHAFENGNKRTALVSLLVFLDRNAALLIDTTEDDLFDLATNTADHRLGEDRGDPEVEYITKWISSRTRQQQRGQRRMRFRELRSLLEELGCRFDSPKNNAIKIHNTTSRGTFSVKAGYPNEHHEVPLGELRRIRRGLQLDEQHGYDAGAFYDFESKVDGFVNNYRQLMNRLADM
jgi:death-on-curing protein